MKRLSFSTVFVFCLLTIPAIAVVYVEDFEYAEPTENSWTTADGIFMHQIGSITGSDPYWNFYDFSPAHSQGLALYPASDTITFDLSAGQYVDYVSLEYVWLGGGTEITITGTLDSETWNPIGDNNVWKSLDTSGLGLGEIEEIYLSSYEGAFDNITINVIPEPTTVLLFGLGSLMLRKKK